MSDFDPDDPENHPWEEYEGDSDYKEDPEDPEDPEDSDDIDPTDLTIEEIMRMFKGGSHTGNSVDSLDSNSHLEVLTIAQDLLRNCKAFYLVVAGDSETMGAESISVSSTVNLSETEEPEFLAMTQDNICGPERDQQLAEAMKKLNRLGETHGIDVSDVLTSIAVAL
jgi:hypothetical protein